MSGLAAVSPKFQFLDSNGNPLSGGKVETYVSGTSTPAATYQDQSLSTPNANPVILDSRGEALLWLQNNVEYRFVLRDSADSLIYTIDNITGALTSTVTTITVTGAATIGSLTVTGNTILGDHSSDNVQITGNAIQTPNGLNFDSNTFVIDAGNNRIGVGISTPAQLVHVSGTSNPTVLISATNDTTSQLDFGSNGTSRLLISSSSTNGAYVNVRSNQNMQFGTNNSEHLRLTNAGGFKACETGTSIDNQVTGLGSIYSTGSVHFIGTQAAQQCLIIGSNNSGSSGLNTYFNTGFTGNHLASFVNNSQVFKVAADGSITTSGQFNGTGASGSLVNFNGTGTVAIRYSHNVSSITDHAVGQYSVNFTTAFATANLVTNATAGIDGGGTVGSASGVYYSSSARVAPTTSAVRVFTGANSTGSPGDFQDVCVSVFEV